VTRGRRGFRPGAAGWPAAAVRAAGIGRSAQVAGPAARSCGWPSARRRTWRSRTATARAAARRGHGSASCAMRRRWRPSRCALASRTAVRRLPAPPGRQRAEAGRQRHADGGEPGPPRADRASGHARQQRSSARGPGSARGGGHRCADHLRRVQPPGNHEVRQDRMPGPAARAADTVHYQLVHHPGLADLPPVAAVEPHRHLAPRASRPRRLDRPADRRVPRESHRARPRCCHSRCLPPPRWPRQQPIDKERRRKRAVYHQLIGPLTRGQPAE
jgi:hypothetical protein